MNVARSIYQIRAFFTVADSTQIIGNIDIIDQQPGDRIVISQSSFKLDSTSKLYCAVGEGYWDGVYFENLTGDPSRANIVSISGEISGIRNLSFHSHTATIQDADIFGIESLYSINSTINITNSSIHNTNNGLYFLGSKISLTEVEYFENNGGIVSDNGSLNIRFSSFTGNSFLEPDDSASVISILNSPSNNTFRNSIISNNEGIGIRVNNALVTIADCEIEDNGSLVSGLYSMGNSNITVTGNTNIMHKEGTVVYGGNYVSFPKFKRSSVSQLNPEPFFPSVLLSDNAPITTYLLYLDGVDFSSSLLDCTDLIIDLADSTRFYPSMDVYRFNNTRDVAKMLFAEALTSVLDENFMEAYIAMLGIIEEYPDSPEAQVCVNYLPYLAPEADVELQALIAFLSEINHENLTDIVLAINALTLMFSEYYEDAITLYEQIISDPPNEIEGLYAELNQAYCYYRLVSGGTRTDPPLSHYQPSTFAEYQSLEADILSKINSSFFPDAEPPIEIPSEPLVFSTSHYPNPFNPETTIAFTIPSDSKVELNIYNIKGQRVKKLITSPYTAGNHKIVWNGTNEQGQQVSSGIYFYQLKTDTHQDIKKMLLLK